LESAGKDRQTLLIVGSSASMIRTLTVQIKVWASEHGFDESGIKGMWGANQHDEWNKNFLSNPNDDHEVDVLLFTHFIQAGLSIENDSYYLKVLLYPISYIDHGLEYQLANRLRIPVPALAYIEKGREDESEKNVKALTAKYQLINSYNWPMYQIATRYTSMLKSGTGELPFKKALNLTHCQRAIKLLELRKEKSLISTLNVHKVFRKGSTITFCLDQTTFQ
jgi:hypothetical protein